VVQHEIVAVRIREESHVADTGVEGVAGELDARGLEFGAGGGYIVAPYDRGESRSTLRARVTPIDVTSSAVITRMIAGWRTS
jgi:hypothetical protein